MARYMSRADPTTNKDRGNGKPYGVCRICGKDVGIRNCDGKIRQHGPQHKTPCEGSGQSPAAPVKPVDQRLHARRSE